MLVGLRMYPCEMKPHVICVHLRNLRIKMLFLLVIRFKFFEAAFQFRL